jgi:hypothetical protein
MPVAAFQNVGKVKETTLLWLPAIETKKAPYGGS